MNNPRLKHLILSATDWGILPPGATADEAEATHPWPVVLLSGLGAWLVTLPLMALLIVIFGEALIQGGAPCYFIGGIIIAGAVTSFHNPSTSVFVEQLSFPALLAGSGLLGLALFEDFPIPYAGGMATIILCITAWLIPRDWVRTLLGAVACGTFLGAIALRYDADMSRLCLAIHVSLIVWLIAAACSDQKVTVRHAYSLAALESISNGWIC